jgi:hypothetical protein
VGEMLARAFRREAAPLRPLLIVVALSIAGTLLNPHGLEALRYPFTYAGTGNASMRFIAEWQSPSFHQPAYLAFAASLLLALALGIGRRPLGPTELLWSLLLALMGLQAIRHLPLYAVVVTPLVGARLDAELQRYRGALPVWARRARIACLALVWLPPLATALVVLAQVRAGQIDGLQLGREPSAAGYPAGAVAYIRAHELRGNLFNQYGWGGYLIYELYPRHRVFVDGRADVYGDALVAAAREVERLGPDWSRVLNQYDVQLVLVGKESPLAVALRDDPCWEEVYTGSVEGLFARRAISAPARGAN